MRFALAFTLLLALTWSQGFVAWAEDAQSVAGESQSKALTNSRLNTKMQEVVKNAMSISREAEGIAYLPIKGQSFATGTQILFLRRKGTRIETVATGYVVAEQKSILQVKIDTDAVIKYPQVGDLGVPLTDPTANAPGDKKDETSLPEPVNSLQKKRDYSNGYLELAGGMLLGSYATTGTVPPPINGQTVVAANGFKNPTGYKFLATKFVYYSGMIPFGVEYESHSGNFPTQTYNLKSATSSETISTLSLNYRFNFGKNWLLHLRAMTLSDDFQTSNTDENLIATKTTGLGFGLRAGYQFKSPIWQKRKGEFFAQLQDLTAEYTYFPSLNAVDGIVSRGISSSGSTGSMYRVGATVLLYFDAIPFLHRWVLEPSYGARTYDLKFSGTTIPEAGRPVGSLPPNGISHQTESDFRIYLGLRFQDPVTYFLEQSEKKKQ
jgi:hypothetical protein